MKSDSIKISAVIPIYNGQRFLRQAIDSILCQTRPPDELVLMLDRSSDDSRCICEEYGSRVKFFENDTPSGFVDAWNRAVSHTSHPYICLLHQDDLLSPDFFAEVIGAIEEFPSAALYATGCDYIDENGGILSRKRRHFACRTRLSGREYQCEYLRHLLNRCPGVVFPRGIWEQNPFQNAASLIADDDFFLRVGSCGDVIMLPDGLASFRHHHESATHSFRDLNDAIMRGNLHLLKTYGSKPWFHAELGEILHEEIRRAFVHGMQRNLARGNIDAAMTYRQSWDQYRQESGEGILKNIFAVPLFYRPFLVKFPLMFLQCYAVLLKKLAEGIKH